MTGPTCKTCPWCSESDCDSVGLKSHLLHGDCQPFNKTEDIARVWTFDAVPEAEHLDEGKPDD